MNVIVLARRNGRAFQWNLTSPWIVGGGSALLLLLLVGVFSIGLQLGQRSSVNVASGSPAEWARTLSERQAEVAQVKTVVQNRVDAIAARIGTLNAHVIRLDALGKRLTQMANIDNREFSFDTAPPIGGPEQPGQHALVPDISLMLAALERRVDSRDVQLAALENVILSRELLEKIVPDGQPVKQGFLSSYYGDRADPITGEQGFHKGVDFASPLGSQIYAVADGVVTYSGDRQGYGNVVEVTHGNGLVTRYAHTSKNLVPIGQIVSRGAVLALVGSSGHSTGPHVHFEVLKDGRQIDPLSYIGTR